VIFVVSIAITVHVDYHGNFYVQWIMRSGLLK
jgi:hypothetical protein